MKYPPLSMSIYERNERLYEFLVSMGHIVSPILEEGTENIKHIYVSAGLFPEQARDTPTQTSIEPAIQGGAYLQNKQGCRDQFATQKLNFASHNDHRS